MAAIRQAALKSIFFMTVSLVCVNPAVPAHGGRGGTTVPIMPSGAETGGYAEKSEKSARQERLESFGGGSGGSENRLIQLSMAGGAWGIAYAEGAGSDIWGCSS